MIGLLVLVILLIAALTTSVYLLGYQLGQTWHAKIDQARVQSREAEHQLHDLTRDAFVAMSEHALRHRQSGS